MNNNFYISTEITKVDSNLGLVMGFSIVCKINGEPHFDLQDDHIPEETMLKAATDFMLNSRVVRDMHTGEPLDGSVVFAFPLTQEVADSFGIITKQTGLMVAMKPDKETLEKFRSGERTGFSIGGRKNKVEEVS